MLGRIDPGAVGESEQETLVAEHMLEHAGEKARLARGVANGVRRQFRVAARKRAEPLGLFGDEGKRLNCQHFRRFPATVPSAPSWGSICLSVTYRD